MKKFLEGEFHTVVTDGPIFSCALDLNFNGQYFYDGCWFQDVSIRDITCYGSGKP